MFRARVQGQSTSAIEYCQHTRLCPLLHRASFWHQYYTVCGSTLKRADVLCEFESKGIMDFTKIIAVIFACICVSHAETTAKLTDATPKEGEQVTLTCVTSPAGSRYAGFSHTKAFTETGPTILLGAMLDLKKNVPIIAEDRYSIVAKVEGVPEAEHYNLTIKNVKFADSGFLGCKYVDTRNNVDEKKAAKLLVQVDGDTVEFAEYQDNTDLDYENFKGKNLKLTCLAKGKIPGTQKLFLGTEDITSQAQVSVVDTGLKQKGVTGRAEAEWSSTLIFDKPFTEDMLSKSVSCQYKTGDFPMKKTRVHLQSAVAKPHLMCSNTEIDEVEFGQPANFSCSVNIKPELTNMTYTWMDGDTTQFLSKGGNFKNQIVSLYEPSANGTMATLTLLFKKVRFHHKNLKVTLYVSNTGGHSTQDFLIRNVGEAASGSLPLVPSFVTILLAAVALIWRGL